MMGFSSLKTGITAVLVFIILSGVLLYQYQAHRLQMLKEEVSRLELDNSSMVAQLMDLNKIADVLVEYGFSQNEMEAINEQSRKTLQDALAPLPCSGQPLPDDVMRMQHELFGNR